MTSSLVTICALLFCLSVDKPIPTLAWDADLELFDLVEEIPQTFYEFLSVDQVTFNLELVYLCCIVLCGVYAYLRPNMHCFPNPFAQQKAIPVVSGALISNGLRLTNLCCSRL